MHGRLSVCLTTILFCSASFAAADVTETFDADHANWADAASSPATFLSTDGPAGAGDGHIGVTQTINAAFEGTVFRGQGNLDSSGDAFVGDWIDWGVHTLSFDVRHDAPEALGVFARLATPANFPGHIAIAFAPVLPGAGAWTHIEIPIHDGSPNLIAEFGSYADTFASVGNIQIGFSPLDGSTLDDTAVAFELDNVGIIVPEPSVGLVLLGMIGAAALRRRRGAME